VSEDLAGVSAGLLAGTGVGPLWLAVIAVGLGIWAGDLGLWMMGRLSRGALGRVTRRTGLARLDAHAIANAFSRHAGVAILTSRFLPGTRVAAYVLAGATGVGAARFALWTALAVALWAPLLVVGAALFGEAVAGPLTVYLGAAWFAVPLACLALWRSRAIVRGIRDVASRIVQWEFWPPWGVYAPGVPWIGWRMLTRGPRALTAANPGFEDGGFVGESKSRILSALPERWTLAHTLIPPGDVQARVAALRRHVRTHAPGYPLILKPDVGQRGVGVRLVASEAEAAAYFVKQPGAVLAQVYHPGPFEAGIFYYRLPGEATGRIFSITDKRFPLVVGDGETTLGALILGHPRFRRQASVFLARHRHQLDRVPAAGEAVRLAQAGNHAQGTIFLDGSDLITRPLTARIDEIARATDGFFIGRFDVRYRDPRDLMAGSDLAIVELNGVTSEATHIYDPSRSLWSAYRTLVEQWDLVFRIGAANLRAGHAATSLSRLVRLSLQHLTAPVPQTIAD
jgi:membrane protein DedA with SNARE-associated domain